MHIYHIHYTPPGFQSPDYSNSSWYVFITWFCFPVYLHEAILAESYTVFFPSLFQSFVSLQFPQKANQLNWNHSQLTPVNATITLRWLKPRERMNKSATRRKERERGQRGMSGTTGTFHPPGNSPCPWNVIGLTRAVIVAFPAFTRLCQTGTTKTRQRRKSMHAPSD